MKVVEVVFLIIFRYCDQIPEKKLLAAERVCHGTRLEDTVHDAGEDMVAVAF